MHRADGARWLVSGLLAAAAISVLAAALARGSGGREFVRPPWRLGEPPAEVTTVTTATELHDALQASGARGRVVVYLSRYLHFVPVGGAVPEGLTAFPVPEIDLVEDYVRDLEPRNFLWVALQEGTAREVVHVLPRDEYQRRRREISPSTPEITLLADAVVTNELGSRRTVRPDLPQADEPVVLGIDAAFLDGAGIDEVLALFRASDLRTDLVILNASLDNPDVGDLGRERLRQLEAAMKGGR